MVDPPPRRCFGDGFDVAGHIFDQSLRHVKAPGLMAHKSRLDDDPRMLIFKEDSTGRYLQFFARTPTVLEREKLLGFNPGYVSKPGTNDTENRHSSLTSSFGLTKSALTCLFFSLLLYYTHNSVKDLFENLKSGLVAGLYTEEHWNTTIPEQYHQFAGDYHQFKGHYRPFVFWIKKPDATLRWLHLFPCQAR
jgi:hypothetical protein